MIEILITVASWIGEVLAAPFTWFGLWGGLGCYTTIFLLGFLKWGGK